MNPFDHLIQEHFKCRSSKGRMGLLAFIALVLSAYPSFGNPMPEALNGVIENHCADCHDDLDPKGGLDLFSLEWDLEDAHLTERWVKVHDVIAAGEMPPKAKSRLGDEERAEVVAVLANRLIESQEAACAKQGRSVSRRVNRFEYQNVLRDLLHDPTLKVADDLPLDGEVHGFAKVGTALDVSHVQIDAYLNVAEFALRRALEFPAKKPQPKSNRYYAREEGRMWGRRGQWRLGAILPRAGGTGHQ